jgi:hypothetical protein
MNKLIRKFIDGIFDLLPKCFFFDKARIYWRYFVEFRCFPNLKEPTKFTEKIQWLKLYERKPFYSQLADKYLVRKYVKNFVGDKFLIPLIGVYENVDDIEFNNLPNKFVLKCTHGSGWNIVCSNKSKLNLKMARNKLSEWLKTNYYHRTGEWIYKDIKPRIICEQFLSDELGEGLTDYKFFCFGGTPRFIRVSYDRFVKQAVNFYNLNWDKESFSANLYNYQTIDIPKPDNLNEMINIAKRLAYGFKFVRVDLYSVKKRIYFGEMTFYPGNGFIKFSPKEYDLKIGRILNL